MRAVVLEERPGRPVVTDVEVDAPAAGEVLFRVVACGVCHSDVHALSAEHVSSPVPLVLGHEPAGIVEAVGPGVRGFAPGDHVVACLAGFCGHCVACVTGRPQRCTGRSELDRPPGATPRLRRGDAAVNPLGGVGGYAERLLVHQHHVVKVDPRLPLERACLLGCGVVTAAGAVWNTADVQAGETVAVIGAGGVGLAVIQAARIAYARRIVAIDLDDAKLELARRCGATDVVNAARDEPVAALQALLPGGANHVFEAIGLESTVQQGLAMTGFGGALTVVGIMPISATITLSAMDLMMGRVVRQAVIISARFVAEIPLLVEHTLAGRFDLDVMVSDERGLDDVPAALDDLGAGRVLGRTVVVV